MARGWESKSVESQMEDAAAKGSPSGPRLTAEEREIARTRESLRLSRHRVTRQLETTRSAVHRNTLTEALSFIEARLAALEDGDSRRNSGDAE